MSATLSIKEKSYLEDAMELENLCLVKYSVYVETREYPGFFFKKDTKK